MTITIKEYIDAPRDEVFALFSDIEHASDNIDGIKRIEFLEGDPSRPQVGLKWRETREFMGKEAAETMWISEFKPPHSYSVDSDSYGTDYSSTFSFTDKGQGTEVQLSFGGKPVTTKAKLQSLYAWLFIPVTKKMLRQDILDLKAKLEQ